MSVRRKAVTEEILLAALCAVAAGAAVYDGIKPLIATAAVFAVYAFWHLLQTVRLIAYLDNDGASEVRWVWGVWRSIFDRVRRIKRREDRRRRRQRRFFTRFRRAVEAMPDGVIVFGSDGEVSWLNPQARRYFGLGAGILEGRRLADLVDDRILLDYLRAGEFGRGLEIEAPGDPAATLSISVTRFKKRRQRYLLVARDITRLHHLNQSQRDFSLNVSHELRTPLTVIHGYVETLFDAEDPQSARWVPLQRMLQQTHRMQAVIGDLLTLSRLESGVDVLESQPVAVFDMLEEIVQEAGELGRESQHTIAMDGEPGLMLLGDESLLRTAFSNLVFNAIRHTPQRTQVSVTWRRQDDHADMVVRDNGMGIPARHLPRLTERFYRVDAGRSRAAGGTGLGLAIVRQILDLHDAQLLIGSEEGRGATFTCQFPAQRWSRVPPPPQDDENISDQGQSAERQDSVPSAIVEPWVRGCVPRGQRVAGC